MPGAGTAENAMASVAGSGRRDDVGLGVDDVVLAPRLIRDHDRVGRRVGGLLLGKANTEFVC